MTKDILKLSVNMLYDLQKVRIQMGGRILAKNNPQGINLEDEDLEYFKQIFKILHSQEKEVLKKIKQYIKATNIWQKFLKNVKGVGPAMAAVIISQFDISKANTVSKMWAYAGLAVINGKAQRPVKGERLNYNSWLRAKLLGVLGPSFLKTNSPYRKFYDDCKMRLISKGWGMSDLHRHRAATRYMIKMFIIDLYKNWRELEDLPVRKLYQEEYLGHTHPNNLAMR